MKKISHYIRLIPAWVSTGVCLAAILWATLSPAPAGDLDVPMFPGADKVVHAVMFGALTLCGCFDLGVVWREKKRHEGLMTPWIVAAAATLAGIGIEYLQLAMRLGRSFEPADMLADFAGAAAAAAVVSISIVYRKKHTPRQ